MLASMDGLARRPGSFTRAENTPAVASSTSRGFTMIHRTVIAIALLAVVLGTSAGTSVKQPSDLSGQWQLDPNRSDVTRRPEGMGRPGGPGMGGGWGGAGGMRGEGRMGRGRSGG